MAVQVDIGDPGAGFRIELDFYAAGTEIIRESNAGIFAGCSFHGDGVDRLVAGTRISVRISKSQHSQACIFRGGQM